MIIETDVLLGRRTTHRIRRAARRGRWSWLLAPNLVLLGLLAASLAGTWFGVMVPEWAPPPSAYVPFVVVGALYLDPSRYWALSAVVLGQVLYVGPLLQSDGRFVIAVVAVVVVIGVMAWVCSSRDRLGLHGVSSDQMLVDLRDRLHRGGDLPALPPGWDAESTVISAEGAGFSGDFVLAARTGDLLELALVDVSGKGERAGTRALQLSGAFGGLLGSTSAELFLSAANSYLLRQEWSEGFATCVHIAVDLRTGAFSLGSAGHPPAAFYSGGSGRWSVLDSRSGPLLGVLDDAAFPRTAGRLDRGDLLLAYSDGVIEARGHDLSAGIDRMLGNAQRFGPENHGLTRALCEGARSGDSDDRAALLVARR